MDKYFDEKIQVKDTTITFRMIYVEGGSFMMGSEEEEAFSSEMPVHEVQVIDYFIAESLVTQELWEVVMGENAFSFKGKDRPVERVSWEMAQQFIEKLNSITNKNYRLPTEAEWEFAARGGSYQEKHSFKYAGSNELEEVGWFKANSGAETKPIKLKAPNCLGLYDISGNVWEWCEDIWHPNYNYAPIDGSAWLTGSPSGRVIRGGAWWNDAIGCRITCRYGYDPSEPDDGVGFRLVLPCG